MRFYPPIHKIKNGDKITKIVKDYGYKNVLEIWKHPDNAKLRQLRKSPDQMQAGDQLVLPVPAKLKTTAREHLDALIAARDANLRQQTDVAKRIQDLKWRNAVLNGFVQDIMKYNKDYLLKIGKLVDEAVKARDTADLTQNVAMLGAGPLKSAAHGFRKKFVKRSLKKNGGEVVSALEKGAQKALNKMSDKSRKMLSSNYNRALKQAMALDAVGSTAAGATGFITDALANETSADSLVGKGLRVVDDATSLGYWGWVAVGVVSGKGWDSFESIQSDAKKKIKKVSAMCNQAATDIQLAMAKHDKSAALYKNEFARLQKLKIRLEKAMDYPSALLSAK